MSAPIIITTASVPEGYCPTSLRDAWSFLVSLLTATLQGTINLFNVGNTTPLPDDEDKPWLPDAFSGSNPPAFAYQFKGGDWIMPHPIPSGAIMLYSGSPGSIATFDGGEAGTVTETTGPMWEIDTDMAGKFPLGPGTLESGFVVAVGDTGGTEKVALVEDNIPLFEISPTYALEDGANRSSVGLIADDDRQATPTPNAVLEFGKDPPDAHSNMPPWKARYFIRRTNRKYYRR